MNPSPFYDLNPISAIDQDTWDDNQAEVAMQFVTLPTMFTPLIDWTAEAAATGASTVIRHELLQGEINTNPIPFTAHYIEAQTIDSRQRTITHARYGDKVQLHKLICALN